MRAPDADPKTKRRLFGSSQETDRQYRMRPVLLNTYDWGGAGIASRRILRGLRGVGLDAKLLVQHQRTDDPHVICPGGRLRRAYAATRIVTDSLPTLLHGGAKDDFSVGWLPDDVVRQLERLGPDVVHLNWVGEGFFNVKSVGRMPEPIVWRLPDMWAFTGGCHYSGDCTRYEDRCGSCPVLGSGREHDLSRWIWDKKAEAWADKDITVVATTSWLAEAAGASSLFGDRRIEIIPNALDTDRFRPMDPNVARDQFNLDPASAVIAFGAQHSTTDPRKGFDLLQESLQELREVDPTEPIELVVFGGDEPTDAHEFGFPVHYTGYLDDEERLAALYSAADVMVVPSRYEGFGQTAAEAMACGTPVVAFAATGPKDIVDHRETGYLATPYDPGDLAKGIQWLLADETRCEELGREARKRAVERYGLYTVAKQYLELYHDLIK